MAKIKNGFAPKDCEVCGLAFEWRAKWRNSFDEVRYCSTRCSRTARANRRSTL
ncbi:MAG: DUF2256 domain-containing protein [Actinobacteria bacterium]|nr:DUF2256 domain-containing protein [Actinomycetota bacterium]